MGIALPAMLMLLMEHREKPFSGTVLQIGRQDIYFDFVTLETCAANLKVKLSEVGEIGLKANEWMPHIKTISDTTFFKAIGFSSVLSVDVSDYENPDLIWDFNKPVPNEMKDRFDVVYDGGSLEHIFHIGTALCNITSVLNVGGRAIHNAPTHNYVDHGFYSLSPTLFYDYYETNHFSDLKGHLLGNRLPLSHNDVPKVYEYKPGMLEPFAIGGFTKERFDGCEMFVTHFSARKTAESRGDIVPMQRRYREWWAKAEAKKRGS